MPLRLYRDDSYLTRFSAQVIDTRPGAGGVQEVELDRTAFYPTGGGQPHDTGSLAGLPVVDVREADGGRILHIVQTGVAPRGDVSCSIDWRRRFDHMQQHTGQHILSRAFVEIAGAATLSFHLGEDHCTVDLDLATTDEATIRAAESLANETIFANHPVLVEQMSPERAPGLAADMKLARELALKPGDAIRIIKVGGFDETPCGGTHVRASGEVGVVAIRSWERFKGGTRVAFACGGRVVRMLGELGGVVDACVARLSAQPTELSETIGRLQEQLTESRRLAKHLNEALIGAEAVARDASARTVGGCGVIVEMFSDRPADDVQLLARKYTMTPGRVALLATVDTASGKSSLVFARSDEGIDPGLTMGDLLSQVCRSRGGKGGGGASFARGGGIGANDAQDALDEAFAAIASRLRS